MASISLEQYAEILSGVLAPLPKTAKVYCPLPERSAALLDRMVDPSVALIEEIAAAATIELATAQASPSDPATPPDSKRLSAANQLAKLSPSEQQRSAAESVLSIVRQATGSAIEDLVVTTPFTEAGIDSLATTEVVSQLSELFALPLSRDVLLEYPTAALLAPHLLNYMESESISSRDRRPASASLASRTGMLHHSFGGPHRVLQPSQARYRVLFLHGMGTNAAVGRKMLEATEWLSRTPFDFVLPDAPHATPAWDDLSRKTLGLEAVERAGLYKADDVYAT